MNPLSNNKPLVWLLAFCVVVFLMSFLVAVTKDSTAAYTLVDLAFAAVVALYASQVLDVEIDSKYLSLKSKVQALDQNNKQLQEVTNTLLKCLLVVVDGSVRLGGPGGLHQAIIAEYLQSIQSLIEPDLQRNVLKEVASRIDQANQTKRS